MTAILPTNITAGVTLEIPVTLTAYPAPDWSLSVYLRGPAAIDLTAIASDNQHILQATAAVTATWSAGSYWYTARVTDGADIVQIEEGTIQILPDLVSQVAGYDGRGHVQRVLDAIEAVIEGRASKDQQRYRINNRELERTPIGELLQLRSTYRDELRREQAAKKGQSLLGRDVRVRFNG